MAPPKRTQAVVEFHAPGRMLGHVGERKIVVRECPEKREHRDGQEAEDKINRTFGDSAPIRTQAQSRIDPRCDPCTRGQQAQTDRVKYELGHQITPPLQRRLGAERLSLTCCFGSSRPSRTCLQGPSMGSPASKI